MINLNFWSPLRVIAVMITATKVSVDYLSLTPVFQGTLPRGVVPLPQESPPLPPPFFYFVTVLLTMPDSGTVLPKV